MNDLRFMGISCFISEDDLPQMEKEQRAIERKKEKENKKVEKAKRMIEKHPHIAKLLGYEYE